MDTEFLTFVCAECGEEYSIPAYQQHDDPDYRLCDEHEFFPCDNCKQRVCFCKAGYVQMVCDCGETFSLPEKKWREHPVRQGWVCGDCWDDQ